VTRLLERNPAEAVTPAALGSGLVVVFNAASCPWCYWSSIRWQDYGRWGEWAWVGRVYP
jgi:hypothetical protein